MVHAGLRFSFLVLVFLGLGTHLAATTDKQQSPNTTRPMAVLYISPDGEAVLKPYTGKQQPTPLPQTRGLDLPDLYISSLEGVCEENSPRIAGVVRNSGTGDAGTFSVGFYLSADASISTDDHRIGDIEYNGIGAGTALNFERYFSNLPRGTWYVGAIADDQDQIAELDESNNALSADVVSLPCRENPDLIISNMVASCGDNGQLQIELDVENIGLGDSQQVSLGLFHSDDTDVTVRDVRISGMFVEGNLSPGESVRVKGSIETAHVENGIRYVGAVIDEYNTMSESHEGNNGAYAEGLVSLPCPGSRADIIVPYLAAECEPDGIFEILGTVRNVGGTAAPPFVTGIYASRDDEITNNDERFLELAHPAGLSPNGGEIDFEFELSDVDLPSGTWYIGAIADDRNQVEEWNEGNNKRRDGREVLPCNRPESDLQGVQLHAYCQAPDLIRLEGHIRNFGTSSAAFFDIGIYFSNNQSITFLDTIIDEITVNLLQPGQDFYFERDIFVPGIVEEGEWYVGMIVDDGDRVPEYNEENNTLSISDVLEQPCRQPDIDLRVLNIFAECDPNDRVHFTGNINNSGTDASQPFRLGFYASENPSITITDHLLGHSWFAAGLLGEESRIFESNFSLGDLPPGIYYLGAYIDDTLRIDETHEFNNANYRGPYGLPCGPQINIFPEEVIFDFTDTPPDETTGSFQISNPGGESVTGTITQVSGGAWLKSFTPDTFTVPFDRVQNITVLVDATLAPAGDSMALLRIQSNAVNTDPVDVPIILRNGLPTTLTVGDGGGLIGDTVRIPIDLSSLGGASVTNYNLTLTYNPALLGFNGIDTDGTLSDGWATEFNDTTPGTLLLGAIGAGNLAGDGTLVIAEFTILDGSAGACTDLMLSTAALNEGLPVVTPVDGEICVADCTKGDIDGSGTITSFDASLALHNALSLPTDFDPIPIGCADGDCNGLVTAYDAALILRRSLLLEPGFCLTRQTLRGAAVNVSLPEVMAPAADSFLLPVTVSALGSDVVAWQFTLSYPADEFSVTGVSTAGTLSADMTVAANTDIPGQVTVGGFGSAPLAGSGTLVHLQVQPLSAAQVTPVWTSFVFNSGVPAANTFSANLSLMPDSYYQTIDSWTGGNILDLVNWINNPAYLPNP